MKIQIEWDCSYKASLTIDGREMTVDLKPGQTTLNGITGDDLSNTIGGIIASNLYSTIGDAMQAEAGASQAMAFDPGPETSTWARLPDDVADQMEADMF
jgi:hypothetical protein